MMWRLILLVLATPALADSVIATRTLPPGASISVEDVTLVAMDIRGVLTDVDDAVGKVTVNGLNAGRPVRADQLTRPLRIERNAIVAVTLRSGGLEIQTEGRALTAGEVGDLIEIMNLSSRFRIKGHVNSDGTVLVTAHLSPE